MRIEASDPADPSARDALQSYLSEVASRIDGAVISADEAADVGDYYPPHGMFLVVRDEASVVIGCGAIRRVDDTTAEIKRMWISPAARGRGAGRALLAALEAEAVKRSFRSIVLDTNAALTEAIGLYERSGYQRVDRYNDNPDATEFFRKRLDYENTNPR